MAQVKVDISMSLDGFVAGPNRTVEEPLGREGERLHEWATRLASWRESHGLPGGEVNADSELLAESQQNVGAVVMGRGMFGGGEGTWGDDPWEGWWGDTPPFKVPVFVLTHHGREPVVKEGGTTFTFVTEGVETAVEQARAAAGGQDVLVAGGANIIQQVLAAGLVDELQIHVAPVLLGDGVRLFEGLGPDRVRLEGIRAIESPAVTHLAYRVLN
jgi:dihydrofolate reductase